MERRLTLRLRPDAEEDLAEAKAWYAEQRRGLEGRFLEEIERLLQRIQEWPRSYALIGDGVRQAIVRRFPYSVYYLVEPSHIEILAVLHDKRDPATWRERVE